MNFTDHNLSVSLPYSSEFKKLAIAGSCDAAGDPDCHDLIIASTPEKLKVDGGAAVMDSLMQFQADQLKIPVIRSVNTESTAMGAAYLAGLAEGVWKNLEEIENLWMGDEAFLPNINNKTSDKMYESWLSALNKSRDQ